MKNSLHKINHLGFFILLFFIGLFTDCKDNKNQDFAYLTSIDINSLSKGTFNWDEVKNDSVIVFFFLAPDCPMCINYALPINKLYEQYNEKGIVFIGVYPGSFYTEDEIGAYVEKYKLPFPMLLDKDFKITKFVQARITPEVFVLNKNEQILYRGKIDDWAVSLSKWKQNITEHYLADVLDAIAHNQSIKINNTEAVGCFIENYDQE